MEKIRKFHAKLNSPFRYIWFPRARLLVVNVGIPPRKVEKIKWDNSMLKFS